MTFFFSFLLRGFFIFYEFFSFKGWNAFLAYYLQYLYFFLSILPFQKLYFLFYKTILYDSVVKSKGIAKENKSECKKIL
jgi:hypothetical protein